MGSTDYTPEELQALEEAQLRAREQMGDVNVALDDIADGSRRVEHDGKTYVIKQQSPALDEKATEVYHAKRFELLQANKLPSEKRLRLVLANTGDWTEEDDRAVDELEERQKTAELELYQLNEQIVAAEEPTPEVSELIGEAQEASRRVGQLRRDHMVKAVEQAGLLAGTVEFVAGQERRLFLLVNLIFEEDGETPVWESVQAFKEDGDTDRIELLFSEATLLWAGLRPEVRTLFLEE